MVPYARRMPAADAFRLDGRVALVTGASAGLGARFGQVLHEAGAAVVLAARRSDLLDAVADDLERAEAVTCDVTVDADLDALVDRVLDRHGRIDVLVNNAGVSDGPIHAETEDPELFRRVVDVNLNAAFSLIRRCVPSMLEREEGSIVNVASVHGLVASAPNRQAAYAASKAGLVNLTRELACQWAARKVRVNALAPGYFATEMTASMLDDEKGRSWVERGTPMGRPGDAHELDGALLFLASDASSYVTGQVLAVDGGWTAR